MNWNDSAALSGIRFASHLFYFSRVAGSQRYKLLAEVINESIVNNHGPFTGNTWKTHLSKFQCDSWRPLILPWS